MPKVVPRSVQTCFEHVLGRFFEKQNLLSIPWMVEFSKIFKKKQKIFKKRTVFGISTEAKKRINGENMQQVLLNTLYQIWDIQKVKTNHKRSCQLIPFVLKTDYLHSKTSYMEESACLRKQLKWHKFPFYGDRLSGKMIYGVNIGNSVSEKITQEEQSPLISRQVVRRNYSEQMTEKQDSVKTCTKSPKKETPSIYGNRCRFDQKRNGCPFKVDVKRLKS